MDVGTKKFRRMIGIDEAGRGPLAGPLVVAGVAVSALSDPVFLRGIRDSKKLTEKQRERWYAALTKNPEVRWAVARISPRVIDEINIARAACRGAQEVYEKLRTSSSHALLDGSLKLKHGASYEVIIKGDEKIQLIAAASIIAKVTRDRLMKKLHAAYPHYGFDAHKGYGTKRHIAAIRRFGRSPVHRMTFMPTV